MNKAYLTFLLYVCIFAGLFFIVQNKYKFVVVDGNSMMSSYKHGDLLLIEYPTELKQGDVIVFWNDTLNRYLIKRIVAVQGDVVEYTDKDVYINGRKLDDSYVYNQSFVVYASAKPELVQDEHVYVLGDNRSNSLDSRYPEVGEVDFDEIIGVVNCNVSASTHLPASTLRSILNTVLCTMLVLYLLNNNVYSNQTKDKK